jgi:hypothetical protein
VSQRSRTLAAFGGALAVRLGVVMWARDAFPPSADGSYYHTLATRLASGVGYTWLWPDGVVTYAAHYPIGYPAILAAAYAAFGAAPVVAMVVNAILGATVAAAAHALLSRATSPRLALTGAFAVAIHPALVPYTAAVMTEGVTAALLAASAALAARARADGATWPRASVVLAGLVLGVATLVRPQSVLLAPVFGWLAVGGAWRARALSAGAVTALALLVCAPWTARNCVRMERCALVSVNGGWNLAIGTQTDDGGWREMQVPEACREVFAEAAKDACFGEAARRDIARSPVTWLARAPRKIRVTLDYFGAAPWYLHESNPGRFPWRTKAVLGVVETVASRLALVMALLAVMRLSGPWRRVRVALSALGAVAAVSPPGALGYLACALAIALLGPRALGRLPVLVGATGAVIVATAVTHAVFFGAGRYGLIVVPFVTALAFVRTDRAPGLVRDRTLSAESLSPVASGGGGTMVRGSMPTR